MKGRKGKRQLKEVLFWLAFILSVSGMLVGMQMFWMGFHNLDLGQNLRWVNAEYNLSLVDLASSNTTYTGIEMYQLGTSQIIYSIYLIFVFSILFGLCFAELKFKGGGE